MTNHYLNQTTRERRLAWEILRNSPTGRMARAMRRPERNAGNGEQSEPGSLPPVMSTSARNYFARRSVEERRAADQAAGKEAREAHEELARLYARLAHGDAQPASPSRH